MNLDDAFVKIINRACPSYLRNKLHGFTVGFLNGRHAVLLCNTFVLLRLQALVEKTCQKTNFKPSPD